MLAIDTAAIVATWAAVFAHQTKHSIPIAHILILAISTWIAYQADRLLDVRSKAIKALLTRRHQFAKQHQQALWHWLIAMLVINLGIAGSQLSLRELQRGVWLLAAVISYVLLNQIVHKKYGLKELSITLIISAGVILMIPAFEDWYLLGLFAWLCLLNCLLITQKEAAIDRACAITSIAPALTASRIWPLALLPLSLLWLWDNAIAHGLWLSYLLLATLYWQQKRLHPELYRVLADTALLLGALYALWAIH
jgi:lipoprotein signal peptidase